MQFDSMMESDGRHARFHIKERTFITLDRSNDHVVLNIVWRLDFVYVEIGDLMKDYNQTLLFATIVRIGGRNGVTWIWIVGGKIFLRHQRERLYSEAI